MFRPISFAVSTISAFRYKQVDFFIPHKVTGSHMNSRANGYLMTSKGNTKEVVVCMISLSRKAVQLGMLKFSRLIPSVLFVKISKQATF